MYRASETQEASGGWFLGEPVPFAYIFVCNGLKSDLTHFLFRLNEQCAQEAIRR